MWLTTADNAVRSVSHGTSRHNMEKNENVLEQQRDTTQK